MKIPPVSNVLPHWVSDVAPVGNCNKYTFEFQVVLLDEYQLIFKKWVKVKMATLQSASDFMKRKYPSPYFFELCKTYKSQ